MSDKLIICRFLCCGIGAEMALSRLQALPTTKIVCPDCGAACEYDEDDLADLEQSEFVGSTPPEIELLPE
jgi:hypothetical protein